ncbi:9825_t:CDS:2, partial [Cetraspora pellucida]
AFSSDLLQLTTLKANAIGYRNGQIAVQDPFHSISNTQIPTTIGSPRNYKSKYQKPSRLFNDKLLNRTKTYNQESASCSENINNSTTDDNVHNDTLEIVPQALGGGKENDSTLVVKRLLEELFLEKDVPGILKNLQIWQ